MCDMYLSEHAYRDAHINCEACNSGKYASKFWVKEFEPSNYEQAMLLKNMKLSKRETIKDVDSQGRSQYSSKVTETYTPWFAENISEVPFLVPVCDSCASEMDTDFIHCHYGFKLYRLQKQRHNVGYQTNIGM